MSKNTQQALNLNQPQVAAVPVTFVLLDQQQSNYFRDEDPETESGKVYLSTCDRKIPSTSKVRHVDKSGMTRLRNTRYIKGCPTIFVDEQDAQGYKPNHIADAIWFVKGKLTAYNEETGVELLEYLRNGCSANEGCKNRTESYRPLFKELDFNKEAANNEADYDFRFKADAYMQSLKTSTGNGYSYNQDALEFLAHIFKLPSFDSGYGSSEAWVALAEKSVQDPKKFLQTIHEESKAIEATVNQAIALKVILLDTTKAMLADQAQTVVMLFPDGLSEGQAVGRLIDFYANPSNRGKYGAVGRLMSAAMAKGAEVIK